LPVSYLPIQGANWPRSEKAWYPNDCIDCGNQFDKLSPLMSCSDIFHSREKALRQSFDIASDQRFA